MKGIIGAIAGDVIGSAYEFNPTRDYNFELFTPKSTFTDDTVLTMANAQWLLDDEQHTHEKLGAYQRHAHEACKRQSPFKRKPADAPGGHIFLHLEGCPHRVYALDERREEEHQAHSPAANDVQRVVQFRIFYLHSSINSIVSI